MPFINDRLNDIKEQQELKKFVSADGRDLEQVRRESSVADHGVDLEDLRNGLLARIVGQDDAVDAVVRSVAVGKAGLNDRDRPLANILLLGPTGVGKTELVRQVASMLRSDPDDMSRIDMSSLSQEHYMASLTGAPPGYAGSKENFSLFDRSKIAGDPYTPGIALFDEVEKAHRLVHRALLNVLDNGILKLANGQETISFRNSYVFMTSNLGSVALMQRSRNRIGRLFDSAAHRVGLGESSLSKRILRTDSELIVRDALEGFFEPEFINRIDEVVILNPLTGADAVDIVRLDVNDLVRRCSRRGINLVVDPGVLALVSAQGFDQIYGARSIKRLVRDQIATPVAKAALAARGSSGGAIHLVARVHLGDILVTHERS